MYKYIKNKKLSKKKLIKFTYDDKNQKFSVDFLYFFNELNPFMTTKIEELLPILVSIRYFTRPSK